MIIENNRSIGGEFMKVAEAEVKCYKRKQSKKSSKSTEKEYETMQCLINLKKDHPFEKGELVLVTDKDEYYKMVGDHEKQVQGLTESHQKEIEDLVRGHKGQVQELKAEIDKLENDKNFTEKRLDKAYEEISEAQNEVDRLRNRGFFDYLKTALFKNDKALKEGEK